MINFLAHTIFPDYQEMLSHTGVLEMAVKGLVIGIVASAPMGPVGILCVQRTLNKGRWAGPATGVGAAASDIIYALLTGFGMFFIVDIIEDVRIAFIIKLAGSILLFLFGLYTYRSNPLEKVKKVNGSQGKLWHHAWTGFLVTFSNPLIVFLFMAMFGQFSFIINSNPFTQAVGFLFIIAGALLWWFLLTWCIDKVRTRFHERGLRIINKTIGMAVMIVSGLMAAWTLGVLTAITSLFALPRPV